jgi:hypothetical protein
MALGSLSALQEDKRASLEEFEERTNRRIIDRHAFRGKP